jgi:hypothetical protein
VAFFHLLEEIFFEELGGKWRGVTWRRDVATNEPLPADLQHVASLVDTANRVEHILNESSLGVVETLATVSQLHARGLIALRW